MKTKEKTRSQLVDELQKMKLEFDQYKTNYPLAGMWRYVVDNSPISIQVLDQDGYSISVNQAHTDFFGVKPPPNYSVFKDKLLLRQGIGDTVRRLKKGEAVFFPDTWYNAHLLDKRFPDKTVWIKTCGFPILDASGKPEKFVIIHENITEQKELKKALEERNQQLRGLTRHIQQRIEEEKKLLSQELHDKVLQNLAGNTLKIDAASMKSATGELKADLHEVSTDLRKILNIIRDMTGMLRPEIMEIHGIETALYYYTEDFASRNHLEMVRDVDTDLDMPREAELQLFRTIQEALNNVVKHSKAKKVSISLKKIPAGYHIVIADNGKGFKEPGPASRLSFGISMMKERMASVGASFSIEAIHPQGTEINITIPK